MFIQNQVDEAVKVLLALKADYKSVTGKDWKPSAHIPAQEQKVQVQQQSATPTQMSAGTGRTKLRKYTTKEY